jgi:acyl carrier protein
MELDQFIKNFALQFDETDMSEFRADTIFKDIDEWSSLTALSIIAMVDDEYSIKVNGEDIKNASTITDLYNVVNQKK